MENSFINKIDQTIEIINKNIETLQKRKSDILKSMEDNLKNLNTIDYQKQLEYTNYLIMKKEHEIERYRYYIERCMTYKNYLLSLQGNDLISIKNCEYEFIKIVQQEYINIFKSELSELEEKKKFDNNDSIDNIIENKIKEKNEFYDKFINDDFFIDESRLYDNDYLNFKIQEVIPKLYPTKKRRKK